MKIGELTAGGVAVHLLATAEVPLSKAPYPQRSPGAVKMAAHRSSTIYMVSVCVCVRSCMCVSTGASWMGQMRKNNFMCV